MWRMFGRNALMSRLTRRGIPIGARYSARCGMRNGGDADHFAVGLEGRALDGGRIDANRRALAQQIVDQPVQRLIGAVPDIIVIAAEQGDAELGNIHRESR